MAVPTRTPPAIRWAALALLAVYVLAAGALLLTADGWAVNRANVAVWELVTRPLGLSGAIGPDRFGDLMNVVLFVPPFAALAVALPTRWWVATGAGASAGVELYQATLGSRDASVVDVLTNTLGALVGTALGLWLQRRLSRGGGRRRAAVGRRAASGPTTRGAARPSTGDGPGGGADGRG